MTGEATLTDALTAAGKTYEEIAQMVAEQVQITLWTVSPDTYKHSHSRYVCDKFISDSLYNLLLMSSVHQTLDLNLVCLESCFQLLFHVPTHSFRRVHYSAAFLLVNLAINENLVVWPPSTCRVVTFRAFNPLCRAVNQTCLYRFFIWNVVLQWNFILRWFMYYFEKTLIHIFIFCCRQNNTAALRFLFVIWSVYPISVFCK